MSKPRASRSDKHPLCRPDPEIQIGDEIIMIEPLKVRQFGPLADAAKGALREALSRGDVTAKGWATVLRKEPAAVARCVEIALDRPAGWAETLTVGDLHRLAVRVYEVNEEHMRRTLSPAWREDVASAVSGIARLAQDLERIHPTPSIH